MWGGFGRSASALRSALSFAMFGVPAEFKTGVDYDLARSLYRNDDPSYNLGAGFVRPIIDRTVEYIGLPSVTSDNGATDTWLNECIHEHWAPQLQQCWRDTMRDSKAIIRFRQPRIDNPLFTEEDRMHGKIELIPAEMADISFDPTDPDLVERAVVRHMIDFDERTDAQVVAGEPPQMVEHEILEIITTTEYRFFDQTEQQELVSWRTPNPGGFVPLWPSFNEYEAYLGGGQSDIEPVLPFIQAFHEVLLQSLAAHKYHSTPKAKFKLKNVITFLENNYPETIDPENPGKLKPGAKINYTGREIFFLDHEEDVDFIEAQSVLGDSKTLLDFLLDCICIAGEIPRWALLKESAATDKDASVQPFEKRVGRKRVMFNEVVVMICKMALKMSGKRPVTVRVTWPAIRLADLAAKAQSAQQIIMGLDVATSHEWIADETAIQILSELFPQVNAPDVEKRLAASNVVPEIPAPAPASPTQGSQNGNSNGSGSKSAAKKAVATTTPSRS
jgi:hypothetical protein